MSDNTEKEQKLKQEDTQNEQIREMGQVVLDSNSRKHKVELLTIIREVEGHESAPSHSKTTKYEHVLPKLAIIEDDEEIEGLLILLNTVGGDVEAVGVHLAVLGHAEGVLQVQGAGADGLDLRAEQLDAGLVAVLHEVVVVRLAVLGDGLGAGLVHGDTSFR